MTKVVASRLKILGFIYSFEENKISYKKNKKKAIDAEIKPECFAGLEED